MANISVKENILRCHPQSLPGAVSGIDVTLKRPDRARIDLVYCLSGTLASVQIPAWTGSNRTNGLWKTTCFEMFIRHSEDKSYLEYNFAPSGEWAAYRFDDYRAEANQIAVFPPIIRTERLNNTLKVYAGVDLPEEWQDRELHAGLSAVVASTEGSMSYWALAHPPGTPDFHHRDCFALKLEAPSAA